MTSALSPGTFRVQQPFHMVWLATNLCNARCLHCSSNSAKVLPDELNTKEAMELIEQFADVGVLDLAISGGEPLLRQDLLRVIRHARRFDIVVGVGTNGTTITRTVAKSMLDAGVSRIQVSIDGLQESHDRLRCWPGLYSRALEAVQTAKSVGLRVHLCCTVNQINCRELEEFVEVVASSIGVSRLNLSRYVPIGRGTDRLDLNDTEWQDVIVRCAHLKKRYKGRLDIVTHLAQAILIDEEVHSLPGFIGCQAGRGQGCVTANGTVFPCVLLPIPIGNVRQKSFRTLWADSPVIHSLQERQDVKGTCSVCYWKERCGGCRAVALARTGDYLSSDPRCWIDSPPTSKTGGKEELLLEQEQWKSYSRIRNQSIHF